MQKLFTIDEEKCKRDGICAAECPLRLITLREGDKLPEPVEKAERQCINCGHCLAVCPHDAFFLKEVSAEQLPMVDQSLLPQPAQAKQFLTARRSIRAYKKQQVAQSLLADLIDTARYAPSAVNMQPVHWLVVQKPEEVNRLAGLVIDWMRYVIETQPEVARNYNMKKLVDDWDQGTDRICRGAPHLIVAHAPEDLGASQSSCTIALAYLELAAFANGLGTCWAGFLHTASTMFPPLNEALALPEGHKCFGAMLIGYPKYQYRRLPLRKAARVIYRD